MRAEAWRATSCRGWRRTWCSSRRTTRCGRRRRRRWRPTRRCGRRTRSSPPRRTCSSCHLTSDTSLRFALYCMFERIFKNVHYYIKVITQTLYWFFQLNDNMLNSEASVSLRMDCVMYMTELYVTYLILLYCYNKMHNLFSLDAQNSQSKLLST